MLTGPKLRAIRALCNISQAELASKAGIGPTAIGEFELGKRELRSATICKLCEALGVKITYRIGSVEMSGP